MKYLIVLVALLPFVFGLTEQQYQDEFKNFMVKYNKSYSGEELQYRFQVFKNNTDFVIAHNADSEKTFTVAINKFGDLTNKEYRTTFLGFRGERAHLNLPLSPVVVNHEGLPESVDWRKKGAVTHIKNQGQCGSCWSFSTTGSVEGTHELTTGNLVSLSEQQLVDCSDSYGNMGCDGGLMDDAFKYIEAYGIETESDYPYTAEDGTCQYQKSEVAATIKTYHDIPSGSEGDLTAAIANVEPVSVAIDAALSSFQFYSGGVYYEPQCSSTQLDHGVLAVGYGVTSGSVPDYYIVKNSWGTDWGMSGYIWMARNKNNNCGIATMASYPCTNTGSSCH